VSNVLAVLEQRDGTLRKVSHEVVTGARRLADGLGGTVEALVLGAGAVRGTDALGSFGADTVVTATNPAFARYAPEGFTQAVAERAKAGGFGASPWRRTRRTWRSKGARSWSPGRSMRGRRC